MFKTKNEKFFWLIMSAAFVLILISTVMDVHSFIDRRKLNQTTAAREKIGLTIIRAIESDNGFTPTDKKILCDNWEKARFVDEKCPQ